VNSWHLGVKFQEVVHAEESWESWGNGGLIVLAALISLYASKRAMARTLVGKGQFIEVFFDKPLEIAEQQDLNGLYRLVRRREIKNFARIDASYEAPENPEMRLIARSESAEEMADVVENKIISMQSPFKD